MCHCASVLSNGNDLSLSEFVTAKVPRGFIVRYTFGKTRSSALFRIVEIKSGKSFLYFILY